MAVQKRFFWRRGFTPNLRYVFHPPEFSTPLGRSLRKYQAIGVSQRCYRNIARCGTTKNMQQKGLPWELLNCIAATEAQIASNLCGSFRRGASLAILLRTSFAAMTSVSRARLGHTNRNVKMSSFRHFRDRFLTTNRKKWGKRSGL